MPACIVGRALWGVHCGACIESRIRSCIRCLGSKWRWFERYFRRHTFCIIQSNSSNINTCAPPTTTKRKHVDVPYRRNFISRHLESTKCSVWRYGDITSMCILRRPWHPSKKLGKSRFSVASSSNVPSALSRACISKQYLPHTHPPIHTPIHTNVNTTDPKYRQSGTHIIRKHEPMEACTLLHTVAHDPHATHQLSRTRYARSIFPTISMSFVRSELRNLCHSPNSK